MALLLCIRRLEQVTELEVDSDQDGFEAMDESSGIWHLMARNLTVMAVYGRLGQPLSLSLNALSAKGFGYYREQVRFVLLCLSFSSANGLP